MTQIQTTRDHDKDILIAGFKFDLAKARAENERLRALLVDALAGLHNDFEPDNQSARYKRILAGMNDEQKGPEEKR